MTQHESGIKNKHGKDDGAIGHNWLLWIIGPTLALNYGLRYIYTPLVPGYMETGWNEFLGLDKIVPSKLNSIGTPHYSLKDIKNYRIVDLPIISYPERKEAFEHIIKQYSHLSITEDENIILRTAISQNMAIDWAHFLNNDLREKYDNARQQNPIKCHFDPNFINVALHIRHGDITPEHQPDRWITNQQYVTLLENIILAFGDDWDKKFRFHIYSLGKIEDFQEIRMNPLINSITMWHLNEDPIVTFHHLVIGDILINAKSAFSVCAAYLNKGIKLIIPFYHHWNNSFPENDNFKNFIQVYNDFSFNSNKLKKSL